MHTTFEELLSPLNSFSEEQIKEIDEQSDSKELFFFDFTKKMLFAFVMNVSSLRQLITDLKTSEVCKQLGLSPTPYSTFRDGFTRFDAEYFAKLFQHIVRQTPWLKIDSLDELGVFRLVDGSVFPTLRSMDWAVYKKTKKAVRLHLSFDLNRMIPIDYIGLSANSSERKFLLNILEKGITYIADRGYFSFDLAAKIEATRAFFIFRIKNNLKLGRVIELNPSCCQATQLPPCFEQLSDQIIRFENDENENVYRLICFVVLQSQFKICTNRLDLTTLQVIILYAFRWQIELFFKFIKRSLNGIHLFNNSENGVNIQFHLLMIAGILKLRLKQNVVSFVQENEQVDTINEHPNTNEQNKNTSIDLQKVKNIAQITPNHLHQPSLWIKTLTIPLQKLWKIGAHWIRRLQNLITQPYDYHTIMKLCCT